MLMQLHLSLSRIRTQLQTLLHSFRVSIMLCAAAPFHWLTDICTWPPLPTATCQSSRSLPHLPSTLATPSSHHHLLLRAVFDHLDSDADGHVSAHDLARHLGCTAADSLDALTSLVQSAFSLPLGDASLDYHDFVRFYEQGDEELPAAFAMYDVDGDGFISCDELQEVLVRMGFTECHDDHLCRAIVQSVDANSDGKIDFHEFRQMMMLPHDL